MQIAKTTLEQLGGNRFVMMTGARDIVYSDDSLKFRLPRGAAKNKAIYVRITLNAADLYFVQFYRASRDFGVYPKVSEHGDIHVEDLRALFTSETGLHCTL